MFIDTHCHLTDKKLENSEEILKKCHEMNVEKMITSGFDLASSQQAVKFAQNNKGVFASVGIYPCEVDKMQEGDLEKLELLAQNDKVVAIGEIGFENREGCPNLAAQEEIFVKQLEIAKKLDKPVVIHCREAIGKLIEVLKKNQSLLGGGTIHCFTEGKEVAAELLKLGFHLSIGGVATFKNARRVQEAIETIPLDKILLETDSPYLSPDPFRGQTNTPANLAYIAQKIANIKGLSVQEVASKTSENAKKLFKL